MPEITTIQSFDDNIDLSRACRQLKIGNIVAIYEPNEELPIEKPKGDPRTIKQNSSMHLYFSLLARALNEAGLDYQTFMNRRALKAAYEHIEKIDGLYAKNIINQSAQVQLNQSAQEIIDNLTRISTSWNGDMVKEDIWRPMQIKVLQKPSTKQLEVNEITLIYEELNRHFGEEHGLYVAFPNLQDLIDDQIRLENAA